MSDIRLVLFGFPIIGFPINTEAEIRRLTHAILATGYILLREAGRLFEPHGITAAQFNVLILLAEVPAGLRPTDLTRALVIDASSITYLLDRMMDRGWVIRRDDPDDRRSWRIGLTPSGQELYQQTAPLYFAALREMLKGIGTSRCHALYEALAEIQGASRAAVDKVRSRPKLSPRSRNRKPR